MPGKNLTALAAVNKQFNLHLEKTLVDKQSFGFVDPDTLSQWEFELTPVSYALIFAAIMGMVSHMGMV